MNEKHVVNLELAKQLKEAGWGKETEYYWNRFANNFGLIVNSNPNKRYAKEIYPAPFATEILEVLPQAIKIDRNYKGYLTLCREEKWWRVFYMTGGPLDRSCDTLPNILATMWIYLKQNNLIPAIKE